MITHYERILTYIKPSFVHILFGGKIVEDGGPELVTKLEAEGYDWIREKYPEAAREEADLDAAHPTNRPAAESRPENFTSFKDHDTMATDLNAQVEGIKDEYKYGFHDSVDNYSFQSGKGLTRETVERSPR